MRDTTDSPEKLPQDSIRRTETALRRATIAISLAGGIPHWGLLPYRLPLIFLTAFYDRFPEQNSRIDRLIAKWIWRGALTADHEDVTDSRVNRLVKQMREATSADDAVINLLAHFEAVAFDSLENSPLDEIDQKISLSRASGKVFVLGLLAANPRPSDGEQRTLGEEEVQTEDDDSGCGDSTVDPTVHLQVAY